MDKGKGKRPAAEGASQTHSRRPPRHPRSRSQSRGRGSSTQRGGPDRRQAPRCVICSGPYFPWQCSRSRGRCYLCCQEGHFQSDCPRGPAPAPSSASAPASPGPSQGTPSAHYQAGRPLIQLQTEGSRQATSGRMYVAQTEEAAAAENVVAGIILLNGIRVHALFDTGASHSFIDRLFAELHGIPFVSLLHPGRVVVPDHSLDIREFCPSCPVRVGDWIMPVDLLVLRKLGEFDVVLDMDWLTKYFATIDCKNRTAVD
uniref:CCHC-type domain-containing protein n=1 Tax=Ananas comosus var. bracteatus TaxID=296719 RepID=A0A6V7NXR3_ANACO|nr:unnamed protein product [Ananas comosus var. bracteatus]